MNQLLEVKKENGKTILNYHYKSIQDIDDVILQLLNEADMNGFVKSTLNKGNKTVSYDVTGYTSLSDIQGTQISRKELSAIFNHLYRLLVYLEDSFIDIDYVLYDADSIFMDPKTRQMYLVVLPCQDGFDAEETLSDCLENIINKFTYIEALDGNLIRQVQTAIRNDLRSLMDFQDILSMLADMPTDALKDWPRDEIDFQDMTEEIEKDPAAMEIPSEDTDVLSMDTLINVGVNQENTQEFPDIEKLREEIKKELRSEIRAEVIEELRREVRAELAAETEAEQEEERRIPYLIRKKTGEVISLNRDTFILGKMGACCDYVIRDNNSISRLHAVIRYREATGDYTIADCNSTNHTYLNGRKIPDEEAVVLEDKMHVHLATEAFVFNM